MRILTSLIVLLGLAHQGNTQIYSTLDNNNWTVRFNANMSHGWDLEEKSVTYLPSMDSIPTMFTFSLWIGGLDSKGNTYTMAETYPQGAISDNTHGPLTSDTIAIQNKNRLDYWDQVFKINRDEVDDLRSTSTVTYRVKNWPGNGSKSHLEPQQIAPFVDVDKDGIYDPTQGDYPNIKGHQALFHVNNDHVTKTQTGSPIMDLEIMTMPYVFNCFDDDVLNNTFFIDYTIINKSKRDYDSVFIGQFIDFDIGHFFDDRIGTLPAQKALFAYNDGDEDQLFGNDPPIQSCYILSHPLSKTIYINNDASELGNPKTKREFYNYLSGRFRNGDCLKYGGDGFSTSTGECTDYVYPGDPWDATEWGEISAMTMAGDRKGTLSTGPLKLKQGDTVVFSVGYTIHKANTGKVFDSYDLAIKEIQHVQDLYKADQLANPCTWVSTREIPRTESNLKIYPNPANANVNIDLGKMMSSGTLQVVSSDGRVVSKREVLEDEKNLDLDISRLPAGIYFLEFTGKAHTAHSFLEVIR